jgi:thioredoxin 1
VGRHERVLQDDKLANPAIPFKAALLTPQQQLEPFLHPDSLPSQNSPPNSPSNLVDQTTLTNSLKMADQDPQYITSLEALNSLSSTHKYLILDFTATWCPPCKAIAPLFSKLAKEFAIPNVLAFAKVDVDDASEVAQQFGVTAMPTFLFLVDGEAKGVPVEAVAEGGSVSKDDEGRVVQIRGADPRALTAVVTEVARLAKEEGGEQKEVSSL